MPQTIMSNKLLSIVVAVFLTSIIAIPLNSSATESLDEEVPFIGIDTQSGQLFDDFINITGQSDIAASELIWAVSNIIPFNTDNIDESDIISSSTFTEVTVYNDVYYWELSIPVGDLNCTCEFSISAPNFPAIDVDSIIVFAGQYNHFPVLNYLPNFQNNGDVNSEFLLYEVVIPEMSELSISDFSDSVIFRADICQYGGSSCVSETLQVSLNHSIQNDNIFVVEINQAFLGLDDGNWYFELFLRDSFLRFSNVDHQFLTFDTTPPQIEILGATAGNEMDKEVFAVNVDDGYDSSLVALTWTIAEPSGIIRGLITDEFLSNSSVEIEFNQSGVWNISVLAMDSVGHFTKQYHEIDIKNVAPEISLRVSANESANIDRLVVSTGQSWFVDASMTQDTSNDKENLVFQWIIDGKIIHIGANLTNEYFDQPGNHVVTLEVTDNDGLSTQSSIEVVIQSVDDSKSDGISAMLVLFCVVLIGLSIVLLLKFSKNENSFNLPKWGK